MRRTRVVLAPVIVVSGVFQMIACGPDPEMRAACDAYIACANHYAETFDVDEPDTSDYAEGALCDSDPDVGEVCAEQCHDHRSALAEALSIAGEEVGPCED